MRTGGRALAVGTALVAVGLSSSQAQMGGMPGMEMDHGEGVVPSGMMILPMMITPMIPGLGNPPVTTPFLPGAGLDLESLPEATPRELVTMGNGDTLRLEAMIVKRTVHGRTFKMYGYNGQYPGPLLRVKQDATIFVDFVNSIDLPSTVHWHGVRLENSSDGTAVTQEAVQPGESFLYKVNFKDAGIYWYHDHVREDIAQDMGLYGNMLVDPAREDYYSPVNREEIVMLDDILIGGDTLIPFGKEASDFALMGRFGNMMLVNGESFYHLHVNKGEVVRFYLTNVANARVYNLSIGGFPLKLVGADLSRYEREMMVSTVVIAPAQRYTVEAKFDSAGTFYLTNRIQAIDHMLGEFYPAVDTLGMVMVTDGDVEEDHTHAFETLRQDDSLIAEIEQIRPHFDRPIDHEITLTVEMDNLPIPMLQFISIDTSYRAPVEWTDNMSDMNWISTGLDQVRWIIREEGTGAENMDIAWKFQVGDFVKIRIHNDAASFHPMNHPVHFHGQRFLVLEKDGIPNKNLVWKDTELVTVGSNADILLELTNPGSWMAHCHIAEHLQSGMMMAFQVEGPDLPRPM